MRIFDENKIYEIYDPDLTRGYLANDRLFIRHHQAIESVAEQGHVEIVKEYPNGGKDAEWVVDIPAVEGREAYDEYEDILVYIPYTEEELKNVLREKREPLLSAFDKWEKAVIRGREQDDYMIMSWYQSLLDLEEWAFENVPQRIQYYLNENRKTLI